MERGVRVVGWGRSGQGGSGRGGYAPGGTECSHVSGQTPHVV